MSQSNELPPVPFNDPMKTGQDEAAKVLPAGSYKVSTFKDRHGCECPSITCDEVTFTISPYKGKALFGASSDIHSAGECHIVHSHGETIEETFNLLMIKMTALQFSVIDRLKSIELLHDQVKYADHANQPKTPLAERKAHQLIYDFLRDKDYHDKADTSTTALMQQLKQAGIVFVNKSVE